MKFVYFDSAHAIEVHNAIILKSGGIFGIKDIGLLYSVLELIQNDDYYGSLEEKLTHLCYSINKNHAFNDGNKRASIALSAYLLEINGWDFKINRFIIEMENIAVDIADNRIDKELLAEIITSILFEDDSTEYLKLKIIYAKGGI